MKSSMSAGRIDASRRSPKCAMSVPILNAWRVPLQPGVDPFRLEANRSPSTDARVPELLPLARGVDRVPAHAGVLRTFAHRQPWLHSATLLTRGHVIDIALTCWELGARGARA